MKKLKGFLIKTIGNKTNDSFDLNNIKSVYINCGRIGDTIVKTPFIKIFKENYPHIEIFASGVGGAESILEANPYISKVIPSKGEKSNIRIVRIWKDILYSIKNRGKFDMSFNLGNSVNFFKIFSLRILKSKYVVGGPKMEKYGIKPTELTIVDKYVNFTVRHSCDKWLEIAKTLDIKVGPFKDYKYDIHIPEKYAEKYRNYFDDSKFNMIFNFRGSTDRKSLPLEDIEIFLKNFASLQENTYIHVMAPPSFYEEAVNITNKLNLSNVIILPKTANILEAAKLVKNCDMLFSVDTGIVHIASSFNKPIVAIYPNNPDTIVEYAPRSKNCKIVMSPTYSGNDIKGYIHKEVIKAVKEMFDSLYT